MTTAHALYQSTGHDPLIIRLPLHLDGRLSRAVAIPALGPANPTSLRVTVEVGAPQESARNAADSVSFPITVGDEILQVSLSPIAATGHYSFGTSAGAAGVLVIDTGEFRAESRNAYVGLVVVAVVAIAVIGIMAHGGTVNGTVKYDNVEVTVSAEPPPGGSNPGKEAS